MLKNLNEQQREAVLAIDGPVMVFAGAGSGKTRTLTYRVAYMIKERNITPYHILAITFTNKATNEMKKRLVDLVGESSLNVTISTFHSLCARILRRDISVLGYKNNFAIIDEEEQLKIINEIISERDIDKKSFPAKTLQKVINYCKCFGEKPKIPFEQKFLNYYEERMKLYNLLDFEDLLLKVEEIFSNFPEILDKYRRIYKYILVDEFQDTNLVQYKIVRMLANESRNIFVVGDDDQSIYSFRGTNYENMNLFKRDFPEKKIFHLTENYRSTQSILNGSNKLISHNKNREPKELFSKITGSNNDVVIFQAYNEKAEVEYIIDNIMSLKSNGFELEEIAILYRSSVMLRNFELGFLQMGIPYRIYGGVSYLRRKEVKDAIAYLKLIIDNNDFYSFKRIINVPTRNIGESTINKLEEFRNTNDLTLFEAIDRANEILTKSKTNTLIEFKKLIIEFSSMIDDYELQVTYEKLIDKIGYRQYLEEEDENYIERIENLEEFKSVLYGIENDQFELSRREKLQNAFDEAILSDDKLKNQRQSKDGVLLSTIHSVKGLEFDVVFVVGLEEGLFPNTFRFEQEEEIEEERRIAYVAVTRARKKLFLTSTKSRLIYGRYAHNNISRFLLEFSEGNEKKEESTFKKSNPEEYKPTNKFKSVNNKENNYKVGDKVHHTKYGDGVILSIEGDIGQIVFTSKGIITKILLTHHTLSRIETS